MREYITNAMVLGRRPHRERDWMVDLFTQSFGRIAARVVGGARAYSKLSPHFDAGTLVFIRLVKTNQFTVTDVATISRFLGLRADRGVLSDAFELLMLVRRLAPPHVTDPELWHHLTTSFLCGIAPIGKTLMMLGHDPAHAQCAGCNASPAFAIILSEHAFYCDSCARSFPFPDQVRIPR